MNKFQIIALVTAMLVGILLASFFHSNRNSKQIETLKKDQQKVLEEQIKNSKRTIQELGEKVALVDSLNKVDSTIIIKLNSKLGVQEQKINSLRVIAKNFTPEQQNEWLVNRYNGSDSINAKIIDELLIKDGLDYKVHIQDTIISKYIHKDSIQNKEIRLVKQQVKEYEIITSNQQVINDSLIKEKKELKKELRKERLKKGLFKSLVIVEGIAIIVLIL